jgi:segregation and condensation protein A
VAGAEVMTGEDLLVDSAVIAEGVADGPALIVDVEGFEGPLDLLLTLARQQRVDLAKISILALADQYLAFIEAVRQRLELAADYLVVAAWLAYLKSRLLIPATETDLGPSAGDLAAALALRLKRLESIRAAAEQLVGRDQLDRDVFSRGAPEPIVDIKQPQWSATLYDLLRAYAVQREKRALSTVRLAQRSVWSLAEARHTLERLFGANQDWSRFDQLLTPYIVEPALRPSVYASGFAAALEMVRDGSIDVHQQCAFAPIYLRKRQVPVDGAPARRDAPDAPEANGGTDEGFG